MWKIIGKNSNVLGPKGMDCLHIHDEFIPMITILCKNTKGFLAVLLQEELSTEYLLCARLCTKCSNSNNLEYLILIILGQR